MKKKNRKKEIDFEDDIPKALRKNSTVHSDESKGKKSPKKKPKKKFKKFLIIFILLLILIFVIWGIFKIYTWTTLATEMTTNTNSKVLDSSNNVIAEVGSEKIKQPVSSSKMPDNLKNAYVAIEDQRFYSHHGVDIKRTLSATFSYIIHFGSSSFGGSTITQQLVKNMTGDDSATVSRKVSEWGKAFSLETCMSKNEILELYLNIIYVGPNVYGVEMGSEYYFNKSVSDLSLAQCAFLAGINHSPNSYNPFGNTDKTDKIKTRTKTVLNKMLELKYISQAEYDEAIQETESGLNFKKGNVLASSDGVYSYHTDALLTEVIDTLSTKKHISTSFATNYLNMAGLTIYSTQDSSIQNTMEKEFEKKKYILQSNNDSTATSQAAMVIIDNSTGKVVGCVGGLGKKDSARSFNRATQATRQTGSAIKPIAILGPALQEKIITPVTEYVDEPTTFDIGTDEGYSPVDYDPYLGTITVRRAVESSQNIPFVKMMEQLTPEKSVKYLKKLGISTLTENDNQLPLALGGLDKGMTPLETAAAYAAIANDGVYIEPTFYTEIKNKNNKTILKCKPKTKKVFSESVSYVLKELLTQPVTGSNGTATYCSISGMDVAAKTGTTNENYDRWLCGFTSYYTAAAWYGFDMNESINFSGKNPAGLLWAHVMNNIHSNLKNASFEMPTSGVSAVTICSETGKLANSGCSDRYTEYFVKGTVPDKCTLHSGSSNNVQSNKNTTTITKGLTDEDVPDVEEPKNTNTNTNSQKNTTSQNTNVTTKDTNTNTNKNTTTNNTTNTNSQTSTNTNNLNNDSSSNTSSTTTGTDKTE